MTRWIHMQAFGLRRKPPIISVTGEQRLAGSNRQ
jgi:hypothetical protein